jgi:hypothetical protein
MRAKTLAAVVCAAICALAAHAGADLYRWVDESGAVHVTDDRSQVPAGATVSIQPTRAKPGAPAPAAPATAPSASDESLAKPRPVLAIQKRDPNGDPDAPQVGRTHVLRFERAGHEISLDVAVADRVRCEFKVDTGASLNTVPKWVVDELGIEIDKDTQRISVVGISGKAALVPLITVPSVRVGSVYVENVEMAVLDTMSSGLLGMPFFNHFQVQIDPAAGELRLTEIDLDKVEGVYGGMGEHAWRQRFAQLRERLALIRKARESVPDESETMAQNYFEKLDREEDKVQREMDDLEDKAQAAGVPSSWR